MKNALIGLMVLMVAGCASVPMDKNVLYAHAVRNCHSQAAAVKTYAIDSTGVGMKNVAFQKCMVAHGFK